MPWNPLLRARHVGALVIACLAVATAEAEEPGFVVVAHGGCAVDSLDASELSRLLLKKVDTWPDGTPVVAVDLHPEAPARHQLSRAVHGRSVDGIQNYWQRQLFSGQRVPPENLDQYGVLERVARTPGAIGYVPADATIPPNVRVIPIRGLPVVPVGVVTDPRDLLEMVDGEACGNGSGVERVLHNRGLAQAVWVRVKVDNSVPGRTWDTFQKLTLSPGERRVLGCSNDSGREKTFSLQAVELR